MISFKTKGNFNKTFDFFNNNKQDSIKDSILNKYGERGVAALAVATPKDSGETAKSWFYRIEKTNDSVSLSFYNSKNNDGFPVAIMLQYGHGTKDGYWIDGVDYINPALKPVMDELANELWKEVCK